MLCVIVCVNNQLRDSHLSWEILRSNMNAEIKAHHSSAHNFTFRTLVNMSNWYGGMVKLYKLSITKIVHVSVATNYKYKLVFPSPSLPSHRDHTELSRPIGYFNCVHTVALTTLDPIQIRCKRLTLCTYSFAYNNQFPWTMHPSINFLQINFMSWVPISKWQQNAV